MNESPPSEHDQLAHLVEVEIPGLVAEIRRMHVALVRCAELAGADGEAVASARMGAMVRPSIEEWAVEAVAQLRRDYDER